MHHHIPVLRSLPAEVTSGQLIAENVPTGAVFLLDKLERDDARGSRLEGLRWHEPPYHFIVNNCCISRPLSIAVVENVDMAKVATTYGKTWHMWQVDRGDALPLGGWVRGASWCELPFNCTLHDAEVGAAGVAPGTFKCPILALPPQAPPS